MSVEVRRCTKGCGPIFCCCLLTHYGLGPAECRCRCHRPEAKRGYPGKIRLAKRRDGLRY